MSASGRNPVSGTGGTVAGVGLVVQTFPVVASDGVNNGSVGLLAGAGGGGNIQLDALALFNGATWDRQRTPAVFKQISVLAIGAEATIWTPAAGKKFRLMGWVLAVSAAVTVTLRDNTAGTIIRTIGPFVASTPVVGPNEGNGTLSAAANNVLTATGSGAANLTGYVFGTEE